MKDLTKEMYFKENSETTLEEIKELAAKLLETTWTIEIFRWKDAETFTLSNKGWKFEFNNRKRAAGLCSYRKKTIYVSKYLLEQNLDKSLEFENTLRHELAHAIDFEMRGTSDHSKVWKAVAREVLCTAERCYSTDVIQTKVQTKYTVVCDTCGKEKAGHKRGNSACGVCCKKYNGGKYDEKYALRYVKNF
jgi:predicted SprT family Zn-dependent metalloprotease